MSGASKLGPVQVLVIGLDEPGSERVLQAQLLRLRERDEVALLDVLVVHRQRNGSIAELHDAPDFGADAPGSVAAALLGIGEGAVTLSAPEGGERPWYLADHIPAGASAAIVLLEHRWAIPLREAVATIDAEVLGDAWVHPEDLATVRE